MEAATSFITPKVHAYAPLGGDHFFDAVFQFNLLPASYAHASWLQSLESSLPTADHRIFEAPLPLPLVKSYSTALLHECDAHRQFDFDFSHAPKRIALLPIDLLSALGAHVCAVIARDALQKIVTKAQIQALHETIGSKARLFALQWNVQEHPIVESLQALQAVIVQCCQEREQLQHCAMLLLQGILPPAAVGLHTRLSLKYPRKWSRSQPMLLTPLQRSELFALVEVILWTQWPDAYARYMAFDKPSQEKMTCH